MMGLSAGPAVYDISRLLTNAYRALRDLPWEHSCPNLLHHLRPAPALCYVIVANSGKRQMKRASYDTIQRRTAKAQRKSVYWGNIIMALIPLANAFYYLGAGGRVAMVAQQRLLMRLLYLAFAGVLLLLPGLAIGLNMLLVQGFYVHPELGDMAMWTGYFLTGILIGVVHSRISIGLGTAYD